VNSTLFQEIQVFNYTADNKLLDFTFTL
jgi:hypothetical protein